MSSTTTPPKIHTYHCLCTTLILGTTTPLTSLKTRASDASLILPLPSDSNSTTTVFENTTLTPDPTVLRLDDGFEKRYWRACTRCELKVAYHLDGEQLSPSGKGPGAGAGAAQTGCVESVAYVLPGGLIGTKEMREGSRGGAEKGIGYTICAATAAA